jgi:hypothetical protein
MTFGIYGLTIRRVNYLWLISQIVMDITFEGLVRFHGYNDNRSTYTYGPSGKS